MQQVNLFVIKNQSIILFSGDHEERKFVTDIQLIRWSRNHSPSRRNETTNGLILHSNMQEVEPKSLTSRKQKNNRMASISFYPSVSGPGAITSSDFENGFTATQNGNVYSFTGQWICPINPPAESYTQNQICVCAATGNCAVITAAFSFDGSFGTINGSMTVSNGKSAFSTTGIAAVATNTGTTSVYAAGSNAANSYINAPFLLGHLGESSF